MHRGQRRRIGGGLVEAAKELVDAILAPTGITTKRSRGIHVWLEHVHVLDEDRIESLLPLVEGDDVLDTLRKLIGMCPALANPALAMDAIRKPRDECMKEIYQLRTVALVLENGEESIITLERWCQHYLDERAAGDTEFAEWLVEWCGRMIARYNPTLADVLNRVMDSGGDALCIPVALPSETTHRLRTAGDDGSAPADDDDEDDQDVQDDQDEPPDGSASTH